MIKSYHLSNDLSLIVGVFAHLAALTHNINRHSRTT
ncbi:hypothetical protein SAMN05421766_102394 [Zobellia uliginosa]|uniref:Uncharacterized protein n=1 Tax=Zobellia uliginosa TaxID=143224 RepID=A0ABY1KMB9_9FLAO|nr:hypothetical protein SAMN05421766_102394 [Zobellia uliginosa]